MFTSNYQRFEFVHVRARFYETLKQRIVDSSTKLYQHTHTFECQRDDNQHDDQEVHRVLMRHDKLQVLIIFNNDFKSTKTSPRALSSSSQSTIHQSHHELSSQEAYNDDCSDCMDLF